MSNQTETPRYIYVMQVASLTLIWIFVATIAWWILNLITVSIQLQDAPDASVVISIVVIPVFLTLAGVLTYVFVGLQRHRGEPNTSSETEEEQ